MNLANIPKPPMHEQMPQVPEILFLVLSCALVFGFAAYGIYRWRNHGESLVFLFLAGGALSSVFEPIVGILGHMYIPREGAWVAFTFLDRSMPVFVPIAYAGYLGGFGYVTYRVLCGAVTLKRMYTLYGVGVISVAAFETPAVLMDVYYYYGPQPFDLWGLPLWWTFVNPLTGMFAGSFVYILKQRDEIRGTGFAALACFPIMGMAPALANGSTALPMWLALGDDSHGEAVRYGAALITLALALMWVRVLTYMCEQSSVTPKEIG